MASYGATLRKKKRSQLLRNHWSTWTEILSQHEYECLLENYNSVSFPSNAKFAFFLCALHRKTNIFLTWKLWEKSRKFHIFHYLKGSCVLLMLNEENLSYSAIVAAFNLIFK
jgi:hypothetical protein